ncbi:MULTISPECIES: hypothetical protein [Thiomicrorhabdus]|uniref:Cytochrome c domain-containing protein n=1 Tax=Thiomicrorhabdus xiamenensis TaxID=2739063 RepID=A0A7D4SMP1_9GAMM|nr:MULTISPECIES: hypothetical protein [Thiomicrorhabdus]MBO1923561.1 hypothetical protein [Thiomicrorhabdus sp. 6S3-12]QKI88801.1 hypothetical protein HQN79_04080 [Thiomicrorhabdus xiamenensis]
MKKSLMIGLITASAFFGVTSAQASGALIPPEEFASDPQIPGKMLGDNCSACHGTLGRFYDESMPPLAGIPRDVFIKLMQDFKNEVRPSIVMNHVAKVFTDAEIERMADYFAAQTDRPWKEEDVLKGGQ